MHYKSLGEHFALTKCVSLHTKWCGLHTFCVQSTPYHESRYVANYHALYTDDSPDDDGDDDDDDDDCPSLEEAIDDCGGLGCIRRPYRNMYSVCARM